MRTAFRARVLDRHDVLYLSCPSCQHLRTETPHWLDEAYSRAIARADTGLVMRNLLIARRLSCILFELFDHEGRFLDVAGGTGLLTRLLRDVGFDAYWEDRYCENVLAAGFEAEPESTGYEAVTAFEALEHMPDPLAFLERCLARSSTATLVFTIELFGSSPPALDWWYYAFATGQHISFFNERTLAAVAERLGVRFLSARGMHMFTRQPITRHRLRRIVRKADHGYHEKVARAMISRTQTDHELMLRRSSER